MIFGSLFSGIEAASCAWLPFGWRCAWTSEIDPFASAVLRHHYPDTPNLGDVERIDAHAIEPVDLVVFGSPCQSFSVAGKRLGLDDPRGNMALVGLRLIGKLRPRWVVWENVPGILSSDGGRDFGAFLGLLGQLGYGFAHTVLDAQHAGVPQRRRRVFVVGYLGDWRPPAAVLFESESLRWNPAPRREAGERVARPVASCAPGGSGYRCNADTANSLIAADVAPPCTSNPYGDHESREGLLIAFSAKDHGADAGEVALTLRAGTGRGTPPVAVTPLDMRQISRGENEPRPNGSGGGAGVGNAGDPAYAVTGAPHAVMTLAGTVGAESARHTNGLKSEADLLVSAGMSVRRLTPGECLKLQGFPPDWLDIPYRGKPAADGNKYRATGNSMAVPVIRWIGQRIQQVENSLAEQADAAN